MTSGVRDVLYETIEIKGLNEHEAANLLSTSMVSEENSYQDNMEVVNKYFDGDIETEGGYVETVNVDVVQQDSPIIDAEVTIGYYDEMECA